jgi:peptidoglycan/LPS O-acetylase OafA/YrhL
MKNIEVNFESGMRFLLMILIMGTNAAPFILLNNKTITTYENLDSPQTLLSNSSFLEYPVILFYFTGYTAVYLFFFLSGYHVTLSLNEKGLGEFMRSRYLQIYLPSLLLSTGYFIVWAIFNQHQIFTGEEYILEIIIMGFDLGGNPANSPAWFLTPLFASYALAPLIRKFHSILKSYRMTGLIAFIYLLGIALSFQSGSKYSPLYPTHLILFFSLGMLASYKNGGNINEPHVKVGASNYLIPKLILIFLVIMTLAYCGISLDVSITTIIHTLPFILIVVFLLNKKSLFYGRYSFIDITSRNTLIIMLIHYPIIQIISYTIPFAIQPSLVFLILYIIFVVYISNQIGKLVDKIVHAIV